MRPPSALDNGSILDRLAHRMDIDRLDLNGVRAFLAVVEHGSFRGAAAALGQPKSTVSRRVAELEARLGVQLLQRTTRRVTLTDVGDSFHQRASQALGGLADAVRAVRSANEAPRGVLRLSAPSTFSELFLKDILAGFLAENPELRLALDLSDRYVDLVGEGFDLAIRAGVLPDSSLKSRVLAAGPLRCLASPAYLARRGTPKAPQELARHDCIVYGSNERPAKWTFMRRRERVTVTVTPRVAVNSWLLVRDLAAAGLGIARVPGGVTALPAGDRGLVPVLDAWQPPPVPIQVVYPPGQHLAPRVRAFIDRLAGQLEVPGGARRGPRGPG